MKRFWQEKNLKNWYTKIMSRWHLYRRKKLQYRAKDISLIFLSLTSLRICVTRVVFHFFLLIWTIKLLMYETAKLYRGWAFNRDSDSDSGNFFLNLALTLTPKYFSWLTPTESESVFGDPPQVSNEKTTFFSVSDREYRYLHFLDS